MATTTRVTSPARVPAAVATTTIMAATAVVSVAMSVGDVAATPGRGVEAVGCEPARRGALLLGDPLRPLSELQLAEANGDVDRGLVAVGILVDVRIVLD